MKWIAFAWDMLLFVMFMVALPLALPLAVLAVLCFPRRFPYVCHCEQCTINRARVAVR